MKKFLFVLMAGLAFSAGAYAKHNCGHKGPDCKVEHKLRKQNNGGFVDSTTVPLSVSQLQRLPDGAFVVLAGYIAESLGDDMYIFTDGTDSVNVEIGRKDWKGQYVSPKDKVMLKGRVDKSPSELYVDVKSVKVLH